MISLADHDQGDGINQLSTMGAQLVNVSNSTTNVRPSGAQARKKQQALIGTEWDVRITISENFPITNVIKAIKASKDAFLYVLVSGEEVGKAWQQNKQLDPFTGQEIAAYPHHHLCLVFHEPKTRDKVFTILQVPKTVSKYGTIRNPLYTYRGWVMHATKRQTKVDPDVTKLYETGTRPVDPDDDITRKKILNMVRKYGSPEDKVEFGIVPKGEEGHEMRQYLRQFKQDASRNKRKLDSIDRQLELLQRKKAALLAKE